MRKLFALPVLWSLHGFSMLVGLLWYVRKLPLVTGERSTAAAPNASPTVSVAPRA